MHTQTQIYIKINMHIDRERERTHKKSTASSRRASLSNLFVVSSLGLSFPKLIIQKIFISLNLSSHFNKSH